MCRRAHDDGTARSRRGSGPLLEIGNTTSRVALGRDPGEWVDAWSATAVGRHWSLAVGHHTAGFRAAASLLGIGHREV